MTQPRILYCHCAYAQVVHPQVKADVLAGLVESEKAFEAVGDLCEMSARKDPALQRLVSGDQPLKIAACFPRAVKWLFDAAEAKLPEGQVEILNMREDAAEEIVPKLISDELNPQVFESDEDSNSETESKEAEV